MASASDRLKATYDRHGEPLRFLVVGAWNTAFSYALFAVMLWALGPVLQPLESSQGPMFQWIGEHYYLVIQWLAWVLAVPQSTMMFKLFVFHSKGHWAHEIGRSYFVYLPMQALSSVSLWFFVAVVGMDPLLGQLITIGVSAVLSYLGHKYFTFKTPNPRPT